MEELLRRAPEGQILRRGIRGAIAGRPNAGKSSLLNQLLGRDRAIVSAIPGTTRDTIEETANIRGLPVIFIDTAGLREARDEIESEGIRRSRDSFQKAEFILHVLDASEPLTAADRTYLDEFNGKKRILVLNKSDLPDGLNLASEPEAIENRGTQYSAILRISCLTGEGLEPLKDAIKNLAWSGEIQAEMLEIMINSRHQDALERAREASLRTIDALTNGASIELAALDLRIAVNAIGEIVGQTTTENLLDVIFSQFCIGK
jgi:tRNA modification GTPase